MNSDKKHAAEPRVVDVFVLVDMDRTLLDTDATVRLQCALLVEHGVSQSEADDAATMILESKGTSLAADGFLRGQFGDATVDGVSRDMLVLARTDDWFKKQLLYGDAGARLLSVLKQRGYSFGIFTHGEPTNQLRKIELVRAATNETEQTLPAVVTSEQEKALHAASWVDKSGLIDIPLNLSGGTAYKAHSLVVIDDKRKNLVSGKHTNIVGIHIDNHGDTAEGQRALAHIDDLLEQGVPILELATHVKR